MEPGDTRCPVCFHVRSLSYTSCDACNAEIEWYENECENCKTKWTIDYWEDRWFAEHDETDTELYDYDFDKTEAVVDRLIKTEKTWDQTNICCGFLNDRCNCPDPTPGSAVANMSSDLYAAGTECTNCLWMMTSVCPKLRIATKTYFELPDWESNEAYEQFVEDYPKITPCSFFQMDVLEE